MATTWPVPPAGHLATNARSSGRASRVFIDSAAPIAAICSCGGWVARMKTGDEFPLVCWTLLVRANAAPESPDRLVGFISRNGQLTSAESQDFSEYGLDEPPKVGPFRVRVKTVKAGPWTRGQMVQLHRG